MPNLLIYLKLQEVFKILTSITILLHNIVDGSWSYGPIMAKWLTQCGQVALQSWPNCDHYCDLNRSAPCCDKPSGTALTCQGCHLKIYLTAIYLMITSFSKCWHIKNDFFCKNGCFEFSLSDLETEKMFEAQITSKMFSKIRWIISQLLS